MNRCSLFLLLSILGLSTVAAKEWKLNANGEIVDANGVETNGAAAPPDTAGYAGNGVSKQTATPQGKGVIIELDDKNAGKSGAKKKKSGDKMIELIVGGQGEDGVAKRGALFIEK